MTTIPPLTPWRRTLRTVFQALLGLAVMLPILIAQTGLNVDQVPWLAGVLVVCAAITRLMAIPAVETFLQQFLPWLSARGRGQHGAIDLAMALLIAILVVVVLLLFRVHVR